MAKAIKLSKRKESPYYYVRYVVPMRCRPYISGAVQRWASTRTADEHKARAIAGQLYAKMQADVEAEYRAALGIEARKQESKEQRLDRAPRTLLAQAEELLEKVRNDEMDHQTASELFDVAAQHLSKDFRTEPNADPWDYHPHLTNAVEVGNKVIDTGGNFTLLSAAIDAHIADLRSRGRNESTVARKEGVLREFCKYAGDPEVSTVTRQMAGDWISTVLRNKRGRGDEPMAVGTMLWHIGALRAAWCYFLEHRGWTEVNPWTGREKYLVGSSKGQEDAHAPRAWEQKEIDILKTVDPSDPIYMVSVIRLHSGLRVEEACCLRVKDIDLEANTMTIGGTTKNQASQRVLPIHPILQKLFPKLIESATEDGYLFDMKRAGKDKRRSHNFNKRMGLWIRSHVTKDRGLTSYTLRHTYSQALRDLNVDKETIEYTTGHKDQSMLFGTYAKEVAVERLREAVEKLDFGF